MTYCRFDCVDDSSRLHCFHAIIANYPSDRSEAKDLACVKHITTTERTCFRCYVPFKYLLKSTRFLLQITTNSLRVMTETDEGDKNTTISMSVMKIVKERRFRLKAMYEGKFISTFSSLSSPFHPSHSIALIDSFQTFSFEHMHMFHLVLSDFLKVLIAERLMSNKMEKGPCKQFSAHLARSLLLGLNQSIQSRYPCILCKGKAGFILTSV